LKLKTLLSPNELYFSVVSVVVFCRADASHLRSRALCWQHSCHQRHSSSSSSSSSSRQLAVLHSLRTQ
jgi:hypothetical protein